MSTYPNGCPILTLDEFSDRYIKPLVAEAVSDSSVICADGGTTREIAEQEAWRQMSSYLLGRQNQAAYDALRPRPQDL
jgi:hypothetical protein